MKPPIRRKRLSDDSTDFRIIDGAGEDLGRVDGKMIVYPERTALKIVQSVNALERLSKDYEKLEAELATYKAAPTGLKPVDLMSLSRTSEKLFTYVQLEDCDLERYFEREEDGAKRRDAWLRFGECRIANEGRTCFIGSRLRDGITDFEHDSAYAVHIGLIGLQYKFTDNHVSHFEAFLTTEPEDIRIYPADFDPAKVKGSSKCDYKGCNKHLMLPDGYFTPPMYEFARVVAGKRISITMGPRDVIEGEDEE